MMSETKINPLAWVDPHAEIGVGVEIGLFAVVEAGAKIGDGSILHPHAVVRYGSMLDKDYKIRRRCRAPAPRAAVRRWRPGSRGPFNS